MSDETTPQDSAAMSPASAGYGEWIPVAERLPEDGVPVALVASGAITAGELYRGWWYHAIPGLVLRQIAGVSHWMPLPEPPA